MRGVGWIQRIRERGLHRPSFLRRGRTQRNEPLRTSIVEDFIDHEPLETVSDGEGDISAIPSSFEFARARFLRSLPTLNTANLANDDRDCAICQEAYRVGAEPENAVQLPCGHILGAGCIARWVSVSDGHRNTCPMCRATLFESPQNGSNQAINGDRSGTHQAGSVLQSLETHLEDTTVAMESALAQASNAIYEHIRAVRGDIHELVGIATRDALLRTEMSGVRLDIRDEQSAYQLFRTFRTLRRSWPQIHHETLSEWEHLANQIEATRRRLQPRIRQFGIETLWRDHGPGICTLLNPAMRPLVEEFLQQLAQAENSERL